MDILEALNAAPARGRRTCVIQRWLDGIPDDTAGKESLADTINTADTKSESYRTLEQTVGILSRLGLNTSDTSIGAHRGERCRCYF